MRRFEVGDRVRVDIPDTEDPDFDRFHGRHGEVIDLLEDDASQETGDERDAHLFTIELEDGSTHGFRWRDLRPAPEKDDETH